MEDMCYSLFPLHAQPADTACARWIQVAFILLQGSSGEKTTDLPTCRPGTRPSPVFPLAFSSSIWEIFGVSPFFCLLSNNTLVTMEVWKKISIYIHPTHEIWQNFAFEYPPEK